MRRLSNFEWLALQSDIDVGALGLPPWGGVIVWRGLDVLVLVGPSGEVFTTDITEVPPELREWKAGIPREYDHNQEVWYYRLPGAVAEVLAERATQLEDAFTFATSPLFIAGAAALGILLVSNYLTRRTA